MNERKEKQKEKKNKRLGHLIEIHKEVYKHHLKKQDQKPVGRRGLRVNKKKVSKIKKMREKYRGLLESKKEKQDGFVTQEEPEQLKPEQLKQPVVTYQQIGKLTGTIHHGFCLREWTTNCPTDELEDISLRLINRIAYKQAIKRINQPGKAKKLIVSGIKEVKRTCTTTIDKKRAQCLIVALNIERNSLLRGVDDEIEKVIHAAHQIKIPVIHTSTRSKLGRAFTGKFGPKIAVVSLINTEGYQDMHTQMLQAWKQACQQYQLL